MLSIAFRFTGDQIRRIIVALMASWIALGTVAHAQTSGTLQGTVYDADDIEIPNVTLLVASPNLIGGSREIVTGVDGSYRLVQLLPGSYSITATKEGFRSVSVTSIQVNINRQTTQNIVMEPGDEPEVITVESSQTVDTESTTVGQVLTKDFLQRIPSGRSYQSAVQLATGVTGGANANMAGGASNENTFLLDGATVTDPVTGTFGNNFNFDAIQQIEVLLGGYDPEYGVSLGGIVNIVTDSGTNNLEFEVSGFYQNGDWRPRTDERYTADGLLLGPTGFDNTFQSYQIAARVSGPLVQDKVWFIFSYQATRSLIAANNIPQRRDFDGHYLLAKLTAQPNSSHRITLLFQSDPTTIDNIAQGNPFQKPESQGRQAQSGFVAQARWQWFLNEDMNLDTRINVQKISIEQYAVPCTHNRNSDSHQCLPGETEGDVDFYSPGRLGTNGAFDSVNWGSFLFDDRWRVTAGTKFSLLAMEDPLGGSHDVKIGVETEQNINTAINGFGGNLRFVDINFVANDPSTFQNYYWLETTNPTLQRNSASKWSAFIQDAYKPVSNFTVRYGVRYDNVVYRDDLGRPVIQAGMFGPRLFASWDPFGDQKTKIAGGWGRFNDTGRQSLSNFSSVGNFFGSKLYVGELFGENHNQQTGQSFNNANPRANLNTTNDKIRLPSVDEFNVIFQREIVPDVSFGTNLQARFTRHLYEFDELNIVYDEDGSAIIGSRFGDLNNNYYRLRTPREARRNYYRMDFTLAKRESRRWGAQAQYSYTFINGTTNSSLSGTFANDPQTRYNYGRLVTAVEHSFTAFGFWQLPNDPWTTDLGFVFQYESGVPLERFYWTDASVGGGGYGLRIRNRGFYTQFNDVWSLSLRIRQAIDVRRGRFLIDLDIQNITNNRAPDSFFATLYTTNRLLAASRQPPLRLQLGRRYQY